MTAFEQEKLDGQKKRKMPFNKTATEKACALANLTSSLGRPRISAKSLAALGLGAAASTFIGPGTAGAAPITTPVLNLDGGGNANWDVNGDGTDDFRFFAFGNAGNSTSQMGLYPIVAGSPFRIATQQFLITDAFNNTFSLGFAANYANGAVVPTSGPTATAANIAFDQNYPTFPSPHTGNIVFRFNASGTPSIAWANFTFTPPHNFSAGTIPPVTVNAGQFFPSPMVPSRWVELHHLQQSYQNHPQPHCSCLEWGRSVCENGGGG